MLYRLRVLFPDFLCFVRMGSDVRRSRRSRVRYHLGLSSIKYLSGSLDFKAVDGLVESIGRYRKSLEEPVPRPFQSFVCLQKVGCRLGKEKISAGLRSGNRSEPQPKPSATSLATMASVPETDAGARAIQPEDEPVRVSFPVNGRSLFLSSQMINQRISCTSSRLTPLLIPASKTSCEPQNRPVSQQLGFSNLKRSSFTESLSTGVLDYPIEHGRRYHAYRAGCKPPSRFKLFSPVQLTPGYNRSSLPHAK